MLEIDLISNTYPKYQDLILTLIELGYCRVPIVLSAGEFAVRGSICDVFPVNHTHPLRIEYFDNQIERLNSFDVHTQKSISPLKKTNIEDAAVKDKFFNFNKLLVDDYQGAEQILSDIKPGDYVVHEDHGIGLYMGLHHLVLGSREGEFAFVQYLNEDKLYVPLEKINRITLYSAGDVKPRLNSLSDSAWQKTKEKAKKALSDLAEDIYLLYKTREQVEGFSFKEDSLWQIDLESSFPHKPTVDQLKITDEVKRDMENPRPMDRVIAGDVGFGKTEIILRAAFKAAENNKQTAILVPTTILAEQHYQTFVERFEKYPHAVEVLSRFKNKKEHQQILADLKENKVKVIIGTHRLLSADVEFFDLGLLVVDEEQRFGVQHKEKIKKIKANVDVLMISATPIPRTLYMALTGSKDFSILKTAPVNRKPILTTVAPYDDELVLKAVHHEMKNKGQVFYLFNNVQRIGQKYLKLKELFPDLRIGVGHGQMKERELEEVLHKFIHNEFDILLCTTIIENGIDIPHANTIIIENVHLLGLAELHQIRGRVGRTEKQGHAYLLYPQEMILSDKAKERLKAIKEYAALGSGYKLALKDLEIRGAGSLLGEKQHGHITAIGFELYCKLLEESVSRFKPGKEKVRAINLMFDPDVKTYIPDTYISHERERLAIYRRIMNLMHKDQLYELIYEIEDRYGKIPDEVDSFLNFVLDQLLD
ncbi:MAG: transcription-repair coupling factor [Candidatus Margulisiibacteriota bacterium]